MIVNEIKELPNCMQTVKEDVCNIKREMLRQQWQIDALKKSDNIEILGFTEPAQGEPMILPA